MLLYVNEFFIYLYMWICENKNKFLKFNYFTIVFHIKFELKTETKKTNSRNTKVIIAATFVARIEENPAISISLKYKSYKNYNTFFVANILVFNLLVLW